MAFRTLGVSRHPSKTFYERWMEKEGIPVVTGFGVTDVRMINLRHWKRLGCHGAYLQLHGLEGMTGAYVGRIAAGASLQPERHLYEKVFYIIQGEGVAEIQQRDRVPQAISWKAGSLFSPPLNTLHRLINYSSEPAFFLAVTTAPMVMDHFHNEKFIFGSDFSFNDRYDGESDYFEQGHERYLSSHNRQWIWETNSIRDIRKAPMDPQPQKGAGVRTTRFEISENTLVGHLIEWPPGRYPKAHYHGGGAVLVPLRAEGYSLMWPSDLGPKPYESGNEDRVVRIDWMPGSVFSPPSNWYQQHFSTGSERALQLGLRCDSHKFPLGIGAALMRNGFHTSFERADPVTEYEDEDPQIRAIYEDELHDKAIARKTEFAVAANSD